MISAACKMQNEQAFFRNEELFCNVTAKNIHVSLFISKFGEV